MSVKDDLGNMTLEIAIKRGRLTFGIFSELVVKCLDNNYKISGEALKVLKKEKLVGLDGNILSEVENPVIKISNMIMFDVPEEK